MGVSNFAGSGRGVANPFSRVTPETAKHADETLSRLSRLFLRSGPATVGVNAVAARIAVRVRGFAQRLDGLLKRRAQIELARFHAHLVAQVDSARSTFPEVDADSDVRFALDELGPTRIEAARRCLVVCDDRDYVSLIEFLRGARDGVTYDVARAEDPSDVGDALLRGLDSVHDYLLAHSLVLPSYRGAESSAPLVFRAFPETPRSSDWRPRRSSAPTDSAQRYSRDTSTHTVAVS